MSNCCKIQFVSVSPSGIDRRSGPACSLIVRKTSSGPSKGNLPTMWAPAGLDVVVTSCLLARRPQERLIIRRARREARFRKGTELASHLRAWEPRPVTCPAGDQAVSLATVFPRRALTADTRYESVLSQGLFRPYVVRHESGGRRAERRRGHRRWVAGRTVPAGS